MPAIEKVREGNPYCGLRVIHPGPPTPAAPSCFTTFLCRPFCTLSSSNSPWASLPAQGSSTLISAAGPSTHPAGLSLNLSASPTSSPHPTPGCLPCSDSTVSRPAAVLRPTSRLQSFIGRTGGSLVCLVCSMPSPRCTPSFQLSADRGRANLVCPQPPIRPGRQSQELWAEATQDDFPEANRSSFPHLPPHPKPEPIRGGHGGWSRAAVQGARSQLIIPGPHSVPQPGAWLLALCASWLEPPTGVTAVAGPVVPTLPGGPQVLSIPGQCLLGAGLTVCGPRQVTLGSVWGAQARGREAWVQSCPPETSQLQLVVSSVQVRSRQRPHASRSRCALGRACTSPVASRGEARGPRAVAAQLKQVSPRARPLRPPPGHSLPRFHLLSP